MEKDEKKKPQESERPAKDNPIVEFVSGLAKLGQEKQGIGYTTYTAPKTRTAAAH